MYSHLDFPAFPDSMDDTDVMSELSEAATFPDDFMDEEPVETNATYYSDSSPDLDSDEDYNGESSSRVSPPFGRRPSYSPLSDWDMEEPQNGKDVHEKPTVVSNLNSAKAPLHCVSPLESLPTEVSKAQSERTRRDRLTL